MIEMSINCHNCNHEFKAQLREAFEMVKCPNCPSEQMVKALGKQVKSTLTNDPRYTVPINRIVEPM